MALGPGDDLESYHTCRMLHGSKVWHAHEDGGGTLPPMDKVGPQWTTLSALTTSYRNFTGNCPTNRYWACFETGSELEHLLPIQVIIRRTQGGFWSWQCQS